MSEFEQYDPLGAPIPAQVQTALDLKRAILSALPTSDLTAGAGSETRTVTVDTNSIGVGALLSMGGEGASDFNYDEADADQISTMGHLVIALATGTGSKLVLVKGLVRNDAWTWVKGPIFASTTQGLMTQTRPSGSGDIVRLVAWPLSATVIDFNPSSDYRVLV